MASKLPNLIDNFNDLLYIKRVVKGTEKCCGYKREYLARNLTTMEQGLIVCKGCTGVMREPTLYKGVTTCLMCSENPNKLYAVNVIQDFVMALEIKCPLLRDCKWNGELLEAATHLETCVAFLIECSDCEQIFPRGDTDNHISRLCPLRIVDCDYCVFRSGKAKDLKRHYGVCPNYPMDCPNGCGLKSQRNTMAAHRSRCELEEVICPFSEYGCETNAILRKDLLAHKKAFYIEHLDMSQNRIIKLETDKVANEWKLRTMKQLDGVEWEIKKPEKQPKEGPTFYVNNYKLRIYTFENSFLEPLCFSIKRIGGEFDKQLGIAAITHYRVIIVDKQNCSKSHYAEGPMNYQLKIGENSEEFYNIDNDTCERYSIDDNCISVRFYFDINTQPPLRTIENKKVMLPIPADIDPFDSY